MIAGLALLATLAGCGGSTEDAAAPVMPSVVGRQLDTALTDIKSAGFKDKVDVAGGGTFGIVDESIWQVCTQSPEAGSPIATAPQLSVKRLCEEGTKDTTTTTSESVSSPPVTQPEVPLTVQTSPELAAVLAEGNDCNDSIQRFADANAGKLIEFDGFVADMMNHQDYKTRWDILMYAGNYSTTSFNGPNMKYSNVQFADLNVTGPNAPEQVAEGDSLHFVARVDYFNKTQCLFYLKPVSTSAR